MTPDERLAAEERARVIIDRHLAEAGWSVQDARALNLFAGTGVAVREAIMASGHGRADYLAPAISGKPASGRRDFPYPTSRWSTCRG